MQRSSDQNDNDTMIMKSEHLKMIQEIDEDGATQPDIGIMKNWTYIMSYILFIFFSFYIDAYSIESREDSFM